LIGNLKEWNPVATKKYVAKLEERLNDEIVTLELTFKYEVPIGDLRVGSFKRK